MHVISRKRLLAFSELHPDSRGPLAAWYAIVDKTDFGSFAELRKVFPSADLVKGLVVFDIGGNKNRLVAAVHFNRGKVYIRHILKHDVDDRGGCKK